MRSLSTESKLGPNQQSIKPTKGLLTANLLTLPLHRRRRRCRGRLLLLKRFANKFPSDFVVVVAKLGRNKGFVTSNVERAVAT